LVSLKLKNPNGLAKSTRELYENVVKLRDLKDEADDELRYRVSTHVQELRTLQTHVRDLEEKNRASVKRAEAAEAQAALLERNLKFAAVRMTELQVLGESRGEEAWAACTRALAEVNLALGKYES